MSKKEVNKKSDKLNGFTKASLILAAIAYLFQLLPLGFRGLSSLVGLILGIIGIRKYPSERNRLRGLLGILANGFFVLLELLLLVLGGPQVMMWGLGP